MTNCDGGDIRDCNRRWPQIRVPVHMPPARRQDATNGRPIDPGKSLEDEARNRHQRTGVPRETPEHRRGKTCLTDRMATRVESFLFRL